MDPSLRACNPIGFFRERLQKMRDCFGFQQKSFGNSPQSTYRSLVDEIQYSRKQTKILYHFPACQLDYTLLRREDENGRIALNHLYASKHWMPLRCHRDPAGLTRGEAISGR
jgi:hypothetical protein